MTAPELATLSLTHRGGTLVATRDRPQRLNAVNERLLEDLVRLTGWLRQRDDIHFLVLDHSSAVFRRPV